MVKVLFDLYEQTTVRYTIPKYLWLFSTRKYHEVISLRAPECTRARSEMT